VHYFYSGLAFVYTPFTPGSFQTSIPPVDLRYDVLCPKDSSKVERPLVILHGLLCVFFDFLRFPKQSSQYGSGMKRNWSSLSKAFLRDLQRPVYALVGIMFLSLCRAYKCFPSIRLRIFATMDRLLMQDR
jgi:hypothetical protein